jgi:nucleoside-diphosphate-sugar epimerase
MCELNPVLDHEINRISIRDMKRFIRGRFIYASSVAAYGSSDKPVTEDTPLAPTTLYGASKAYCESVLPEAIHVRSASVCGYSLNQRFDLTINQMTHDAVRKGVITVNGGEQVRSHIHIKDLCDFYCMLLTAPIEKVRGQAFNVVAANMPVIDSAKLVQEVTGAIIDQKPRSDNRSYMVSGAKAEAVLGWKPKHPLKHAINDMKIRLEDGYWKDSDHPRYRRMHYGII